MDVNIVIPTYNGKHLLPNLFKALENQTYNEFRIFLVIDGSTDGTFEYVEKYQTSLQLEIVCQENLGRAAVRNKGVSKVQSGLIIFFDDDMLPDSDCIEKHVKFHSKNKNVILVGGCILDNDFDEMDHVSSFRYHREKLWMDNSPDDIRCINFSNYVFTTGNLSMLTSVFNKIGGFDPCLTDSEDYDFSMRALILNVPIYYEKNARTIHRDHVSLEKYITRQTEYLRSKNRLATIHPEYIKLNPQTFAYNEIRITKKVLGLFFRLNSVWRFILNSCFYHCLTQRIRFKIIDWVVFSTVLWNLEKRDQ